MKQQWALMLEQLHVATRIMLDGHDLIPAWHIEGHDASWLILTPLDRNSPEKYECVLQRIRRFMVWKGAQAFVLVCATAPGPKLLRSNQEAVVAISHVRGERLVFMQRIRWPPARSFGGLECVKPRDIDPCYWHLLPGQEDSVASDEATALAEIFAEDGELPAQKLR
jgi:hypothetical protein